MLKQWNVESTSMQASMHANKDCVQSRHTDELACIKPNLLSTSLRSINQISVFSQEITTCAAC